MAKAGEGLDKKAKRGIDDQQNPTELDLYNKIQLLPSLRYKAFAALLYASGSRVSEILGTRRRNAEGGKERDKIVLARVSRWTIPPVRKSDLYIDTDRCFLIIRNVRTLKRQGRPLHEIIYKFNGPGEQRFFTILTDYIATLGEDDYLFTFTREYGWKIINQYIGITPHKFRGLRATKDAVTYQLSAMAIKKKYNWASDTMPMKYASLNQEDIKKQMETISGK